VTILINEKVIYVYRQNDFRTELGMYDNRFINNSVKYYVKNVFIDKLNE
jgi:hypothetical protein